MTEMTRLHGKTRSTRPDISGLGQDAQVSMVLLEAVAAYANGMRRQHDVISRETSHLTDESFRRVNE